MSEGAISQVKNAPGAIKRAPLTALTIGAIALIVVVAVEVFYPGAITDPIRRFLGRVGVRKSDPSTSTTDKAQ